MIISSEQERQGKWLNKEAGYLILVGLVSIRKKSSGCKSEGNKATADIPAHVVNMHVPT